MTKQSFEKRHAGAQRSTRLSTHPRKFARQEQANARKAEFDSLSPVGQKTHTSENKRVYNEAHPIRGNAWFGK